MGPFFLLKIQILLVEKSKNLPIYLINLETFSCSKSHLHFKTAFEKIALYMKCNHFLISGISDFLPRHERYSSCKTVNSADTGAATHQPVDISSHRQSIALPENRRACLSFARLEFPYIYFYRV